MIEFVFLSFLVSDPDGGVPLQIFSLVNLEVLTLKNLLIKSIPKQVKNLTKLRNLQLNDCIALDGISPQLAYCGDIEGNGICSCNTNDVEVHTYIMVGY